MKTNLIGHFCALAVSVLLSATALSAQSSANVVTGTVRDDAGPLPGAYVVMPSSGKATVTDTEGRFSLDIGSTKSAVLEFSFLNCITQTRTVSPGEKIEVTLKPDANILEEVVVIGYGEVGKHDVTGTVATVSTKEIARSAALGVDQAIQGRVSGVKINSADGQPGVDSEVIIRGANSLTQDNNPLYVVDGFPMEDFSLSSLPSTDIKSFTVLKDASATAIYGSRGANGVIIIETRQGEVGKPKIVYNGTIGFQQVTKKMDMMKAYDYVNYQIQLNPGMEERYLSGEGKTLEDYRNVESIDWQDQLFHTALIQKHNAGVSGGNSSTKYNVSFTYTGQDGVIRNSGYRRYQGKVSLNQKIFKALSMRFNATYFEDKRYGQLATNQLDTSTGYQTYLMYRTWAFRPVTLQNYKPLDIDDEDDDYSAMYDGNTLNPIISNNNEQKQTSRKSLVASIRFDWTIIPGLKFQTQAGINRRTTENENFYNSLTYNGRNRPSNSYGVNADVSTTTLNEWMNENTLTFRKKIDRHNFDAMAGFSISGSSSKADGFRTIQIPNENMGLPGMDDGTLYSADYSVLSSRLMSALARVNYSYRNRYLFTASFRADGSSKFGKGRQWGYFPSAAFAWSIKDEPWMRTVTSISNTKIRVSWGRTGNNRINDYSRYSYLENSGWYSFGNGVPGIAYRMANLGNEDLKWETTGQLNVGLDFSMFDDRIGLVVDLYSKVTRDLLLNANVSATTGMNKVYRNIGSIGNKGLEITLNMVPVKTKNFSWHSDFNISFNRSKVLSLSDDENQMLTSVKWTGNFDATPLYITQVGGPMTAFYGFVYDGLYQVEDFDKATDGSYVLKAGVPTNGDSASTIQPGYIRYKDINNDGEITDADRVVIGRAEPIHVGGFNNVFTYKNWELSIFLQWSYGNCVMNANRIMFEGNQSSRPINQFASYVDRYDVNDPSTYGSSNHAVRGGGPLGYYSTRTLEDGSYLRIKNVQLVYNFPKKLISKAKMSGLQLALSGDNLYTFTKYTGLDPEVSTKHSSLTPGFDYSAYARNRIITFGVNLTF